MCSENVKDFVKQNSKFSPLTKMVLEVSTMIDDLLFTGTARSLEFNNVIAVCRQQSIADSSPYNI